MVIAGVYGYSFSANVLGRQVTIDLNPANVNIHSVNCHLNEYAAPESRSGVFKKLL
jgi:hypothetical protein